jgi:ketosteroid isomerase-like protein
MRYVSFLIILGVGLPLAGPANAGDKEDVISVQDVIIAAWNAGNIDTVQKYYGDEFRSFDPNGELLTAWNWNSAKEWFETGSISITKPQHRQVRIFGNTALLTYYTKMTIKHSDGSSEIQTRRNTTMMVKQSGQWKVEHYHASLLTPTNSGE